MIRRCWEELSDEGGGKKIMAEVVRRREEMPDEDGKKLCHRY